NAETAARALAPLLRGHQIVITHGNGPQIGLLALRAGGGDVPPEPLDVLGAESEGLIGYLLARAIASHAPDIPILSVLTQVEVSADDPAFAHPTKPIGPFYGLAEWRRLAGAHGWAGVEDRGQMRRVVPSPHPRGLVEREALLRLIGSGVVPICAGGGGIPVQRAADGTLRGIEAVVDKDRTAALLAAAVAADMLLLLTDVDGVYADWGRPQAQRLVRITAADAERLALAPGSMGPKVEAGLWFAAQTGGRAVVAALEQAEAALAGTAGTMVGT
ncbi:MAG: carbamate kinase, partial [Rhodospirillaceae bacterium]|nr:carbamate kinase [Rhodospirillaceae bacterium]